MQGCGRLKIADAEDKAQNASHVVSICVKETQRSNRTTYANTHQEM